MAQLLFRTGSRTDRNLTPKPKDLIPAPGSAPGLSAFDTPGGTNARKGERIQVADVELLQYPLSAIPDDVSQGGSPGHWSITVTDGQGGIDTALLAEWAANRDIDPPHRLAVLLKAALVGERRA